MARRASWVLVNIGCSYMVYVSFSCGCARFGDVIQDEKDHVGLVATV